MTDPLQKEIKEAKKGKSYASAKEMHDDILKPDTPQSTMEKVKRYRKQCEKSVVSDVEIDCDTLLHILMLCETLWRCWQHNYKQRDIVMKALRHYAKGDDPSIAEDTLYELAPSIS